MLNQITLTCFRKHQALTIDFTNGIQVIRAGNECGKSSLLEGIGYALFGARALRTTFDQAVTWGEDAKRLKVSLTLTVGDATYTFTRGKSGAEVLFQGKVFVTGQDAVTSFASHLLGADVGTANKLMVASQNSIRGALEEGPKALSQMIEDLAGFDTFDRILGEASTKLALGSPAMAEDRLKRAEASLTDMLSSVPPEPDVVEYEKALGEMQAKLDRWTEQLPGLRTASAGAVKAWQDGSALYLKRVALEEKVDRALRTLKDADKLVKELMPATKVVVDTSPIEWLKEQIALSLDHNKRKAAYKAFLELPHGSRLNVSSEAFSQMLRGSDTAVSVLNSKIADLRYAEKGLKAKRFDSDTCSKCGQKLPDATRIAAVNAEVDKELGACRLAIVDLEEKLDKEREYQKKLTDLAAFATRYTAAADQIRDYVVWDITTYPGTATWNGPVPEGDAADVVALRRRILDIETQAKAVDSAKAKLELAVEQMSKADDNYLAAVKAFADFDGPTAEDIVALTAVKDQAIADEQVAEGTLIVTKAEMAALTKEHEAAVALWTMAQKRVESTRAAIAECKEEIKVLAFNNALVKKLRAIRPIIANKLWNTVLASVSVMFSTMRKEESWVTKEGSGFMVNGQPVESLSGSTLDILGMAIRCAMLRTFLPQCGLLVLDEPGHGCDSERVESMLGFLKGVNFQQTLLVSHEEVSETVADNLIIL
jgi:DNA repair exonuclease SbcCD ATPase subunit